jgi:mRNA-degrading endonuclease RelE of RelBE toxin-antitoxin system
MRYAVFWTREALALLGRLRPKATQRTIVDETEALEENPSLGKPLQGELDAYRSLRVVRQRYRVIYRIDSSDQRIYVVYLGRRRAGRRDDIYELARKLLKTRLIP